MNYPWGTSPTSYKITTSSVHVPCRYVTAVHFKYLHDYILIWTCLQCANLRRVSLQEPCFERITVIGTLCYQLLYYTLFSVDQIMRCLLFVSFVYLIIPFLNPILRKVSCIPARDKNLEISRKHCYRIDYCYIRHHQVHFVEGEPLYGDTNFTKIQFVPDKQ